MIPRTGRITVDVLFASFILIATAYLALDFMGFYVETALTSSRTASCLLASLRTADFLLHTTDGLAVDRGGIVPGNVVDCSRLPSVMYTLLSKGLDGYVSCGNISFGDPGPVVVKRRAVWNGTPVDVVVGVCP